MLGHFQLHCIDMGSASTCCLPRNVIDRFQMYNHPVYIQLRWPATNLFQVLMWDGEVSRQYPTSIEVSTELFVIMELDPLDATEAEVTVLQGIQNAVEVHTTSASEYDWNVVNSMAEVAEREFLKQISVVFVGQKIRLYVSTSMSVCLIINSISTSTQTESLPVLDSSPTAIRGKASQESHIGRNCEGNVTTTSDDVLSESTTTNTRPKNFITAALDALYNFTADPMNEGSSDDSQNNHPHLHHTPLVARLTVNTTMAIAPFRSENNAPTPSSSIGIDRRDKEDMGNDPESLRKRGYCLRHALGLLPPLKVLSDIHRTQDSSYGHWNEKGEEAGVGVEGKSNVLKENRGKETDTETESVIDPLNWDVMNEPNSSPNKISSSITSDESYYYSHSLVDDNTTCYIHPLYLLCAQEMIPSNRQLYMPDDASSDCAYKCSNRIDKAWSFNGDNDKSLLVLLMKCEDTESGGGGVVRAITDGVVCRLKVSPLVRPFHISVSKAMRKSLLLKDFDSVVIKVLDGVQARPVLPSHIRLCPLEWRVVDAKGKATANTTATGLVQEDFSSDRKRQAVLRSICRYIRTEIELNGTVVLSHGSVVSLAVNNNMELSKRSSKDGYLDVTRSLDFALDLRDAGNSEPQK
eukprot:gene7317-14915_t